MTKEAFHKLMTDPKTPARLAAMIADNAKVDAQLAAKHEEFYTRVDGERLFQGQDLPRRATE